MLSRTEINDLNRQNAEYDSMLEPLESGKLHVGDVREKGRTEAQVISLLRYIATNEAIIRRYGSSK
jgi:hypothetical protein